MRSAFLLATCLLSVFAIPVANSVGDEENPAPIVTFTTYPPGQPTAQPEPNIQLDHGQRYANADQNPFYRQNALVYGPYSTVQFLNTPQGDSAADDACYSETGRIEEQWAKHQNYILWRNGTLQPAGFSLDLFKELDIPENNVISEITRGQRIEYGGTTHDTRRRDDDHSLERRYIIGADTRVQINNTWPFPFSTVGFVGSGCTGTLVGPRHVLTAGHCVHSGGTTGAWRNDIDFVIYHRPAAGNTSVSTFSAERFSWERVWSVRGWVDSRDLSYDYALIILEEPNRPLPWMSFGYHDGLSPGWRLNLNAHHGEDQDPKIMWHSFGSVIPSVTNEWFDHDLDIVKGTSGGGLYQYIASRNKRTVYGIQSTQHPFPESPIQWNRATRINRLRFWQICRWINVRSVC